MIVPFRRHSCPDRAYPHRRDFASMGHEQNSSCRAAARKAVEYCGSEGSGVFFDERAWTQDSMKSSPS